MKIMTKNQAPGAIRIKVDGKKLSGRKDGDDVPQITHAAEFDDNGNADVADATGKALVAAVTGITEGHHKAPASTEK